MPGAEDPLSPLVSGRSRRIAYRCLPRAANEGTTLSDGREGPRGVADRIDDQMWKVSSKGSEPLPERRPGRSQPTGAPPLNGSRTSSARLRDIAEGRADHPIT